VRSVRRPNPLYGRFRFALENRPARITVPKVDIADVVRGPSPTLPNSVSPGKTKQIAATITPTSLPAGTFFKFVVDNQGDADAGSATITVPGNGQLTASGNITVKGGTQTKVGHGGKLKIVAQLNGDPAKICGRSNGFSVCAHPHKFSTARLSDINGIIDGLERVGVKVKNEWESDSGAGATFLGDLNKADIFEVVSAPDPINTPPFLNPPGFHVGQFFLANTGILIDLHTWTRSDIQATVQGQAVFKQLIEFDCDRCGADSKPCEKSGFEIKHVLRHMGNSWRHRTRKDGAAVPNISTGTAAATGTAQSDIHAILPP